MDEMRANHKVNKPVSLHILVDFNFSAIDWNTRLNKFSGKSLSDCEGQALINILNDQSAEQLVSFPTRKENTLDLLITTLPNQFTEVCTRDTMSDHDILSAKFNFHKPQVKQPKRKFFQYAKGDYQSIKQDARKFTREKYFNGYQDNRDINTNWRMIKEFISNAANKYIPCKTTSNKKHLPWISKQIRTKMRRKDRIHKLAKQTGSLKLLNKWKALRAEIKQDIKNTHDEYVNNMIGDISKDSKPFWKYINSQKNRPSRNSSSQYTKRIRS